MTEQQVTEYDVDAVARVLDPQAWDTYDRCTSWERHTGNTMPVDALNKFLAPSRSQAFKVLRSLESYSPPISEHINHETSIYELRNMYVRNRYQVFPGDDSIPGDRAMWSAMLEGEFWTAIREAGLKIAEQAFENLDDDVKVKAMQALKDEYSEHA